MEVLGPSTPAPTKQELISQLSKHINIVLQSEQSDEADIDRIWILRKIHKNYLYYRDLAYFAPALYQGLVDATGIDGSLFPDTSSQYAGMYDYTQNIYRGYCRKLCAVLGTRIPNATAVPDNPANEDDVRAARAANDAAQYIRMTCELQVLVLWMVFSLYNFGTSFWSLEWVEDGEKNGYKDVPAPPEAEPVQLGGEDPDFGGGFQVEAPKPVPPQKVPKGALEIEVLDASEVSVPLDADGKKGEDDCHWIRREREVHKSKPLLKYGDALRKAIKSGENAISQETASSSYGESIRSAMGSPIGLVRPKRENRWTEVWEDWTPGMYELVDDQNARQMFKDNFPEGVRITMYKGIVMDLEARKITRNWVVCQPEPTKRIMADPLGDDWVVTQDLLNNTLNQANETIERSNEPGFADPTRVDLDAYQRRRAEPADYIPAMRPPGGRLEDIVYRPPAVQFSEQIPAFRAQVEETSKETSGLLDPIWGGDTSDPTARQTELKTNAAIRQLGVIWVMIGRSLEKVYFRACDILAEHEDGVLSFSKKNQFGKFDTVSVVIADLKGGKYHFEADEAIPMTWGQQRDLLMWMLDKPAEILKAWGLDDPLNIYEFKSLLGMPGMRVPHLDDRDKGMAIISKLLQEQPTPGQPGPDGSPGQPQPSIPPDWEDDSDFMGKLAKAYLTQNFELQESNSQGYQNVMLWGQAHEKKANQPPPPPPSRDSVTFAAKSEDVGSEATMAILQKAGLLPPGVQVQQQPMPKLAPGMPPPAASGAMPPPAAPPAPGGPQ